MEEEPEVLSRIDFVVARFNTDGTLDASFGSGGRVVTDLGAEDEAEAVAIQPDGKIVIVGVTYVSYYAFSHGTQPFRKTALARYNPDGSLDSSFGSGGVVVTNFVPDTSVATAIAVSGVKIVITRPGFALTRFNGDGSLDTAFGVGGTAALLFGEGASVSAVVVQPDKKLVAAGSATVNGKSVFALARLHDDGSLDATFGSGGAALTTFSADNPGHAMAVAIQSDGKIVAGGSVFQPTVFNGHYDFALARYNADGSLDAGFGSGGVTSAPVGETSCGDKCGASAISLQPNGKIIAVGRRFAARFNRGGTPDVNFGNLGVVALGTFGQFTGVLAQSDDRIILSGGVTSPIPNILFTDKTCGNGNLLLARYKVVVEVQDGDEGPVGDDGIPIDAPDIVRLYAPLVFLYSDENYRPADAVSYIANSELRWSHQGAPEAGFPDYKCDDHRVADWGTIVRSKLGNSAHQTGDAAGVSTPPYLHNVRSLSSCAHSSRVLTTRDHTRPHDGSKRRNILSSDSYQREGFYLDAFDDELFRQGFPNQSPQPDDEYAGAPVYYEYVPRQFVTYWFFYAYNKFEVRVPAVGLPTPFEQSHEGDWEQVSIRLDCQDKPVEIAYYNHGAAVRLPWPAAGGGADSLSLAASHPMVYVAKGSHASYPNLGSHPGLTGEQEDRTDAGRAWRTWRSLKPIKKQDWYGYGGAWGKVAAFKDFSGPLGPSIYKASYPQEWSALFTCGTQ